jgi:hypothetical protein
MEGSFINAHIISPDLASLAAAIQIEHSGLDVDSFSTSHDSRLTTFPVKVRFFYVRYYEYSSNTSIGNSPHNFRKLNAQVRLIQILLSPSPIHLHRSSPSHSSIHTSAPDTDSHPPTPISSKARPPHHARPKTKRSSVRRRAHSAEHAYGPIRERYSKGERLCVSGV